MYWGLILRIGTRKMGKRGCLNDLKGRTCSLYRPLARVIQLRYAAGHMPEPWRRRCVHVSFATLPVFAQPFSLNIKSTRSRSFLHFSSPSGSSAALLDDKIALLLRRTGLGVGILDWRQDLLQLERKYSLPMESVLPRRRLR